jgi:hypothetical protein
MAWAKILSDGADREQDNNTSKRGTLALQDLAEKNSIGGGNSGDRL